MKDSNRMLLESSRNTLGEMKINSRQSVSNMSSFIAAFFAKKTSGVSENKGDLVKLKKILAFLNNVLNKIMNTFSFRKNYYKETGDGEMLVNENGDAIVTHEEKYISTL